MELDMTSVAITATKADRKLAWPYADFHCLPDGQMTERWFSGYYDNLPQGHAIRAFAQHRINSRETLFDALKAAVSAIEDDTGLDDAICCSGHDCGCRGSSHRQLLLHDLRSVLLDQNQ